MNYNILSNIHSYIDLYSVSKLIYSNKNNAEINKNIMERLSNVYNTSYDNIKYKIHNYQSRCGKCEELFQGNYVVRLGNINCQACGEKKNFNVEFCQNCFKKEITRGKWYFDFCSKNNHKIVYLGINILS